MRTGYIVRHRATGALLGVPKAGRLEAVSFWGSHDKALSYLVGLHRSGKLKHPVFEWEIIQLKRFG